jgi:hypothetical protein
MSLKLLKLLRLTGAPHYAYRSIMDIFAGTLASKIVTAGATFRRRDKAIKHFANRLVQLLLKSSLMVEENMLFPDMDNPLAPPPPTVETIADVNTGQVFRSAHQAESIFNSLGIQEGAMKRRWPSRRPEHGRGRLLKLLIKGCSR